MFRGDTYDSPSSRRPSRLRKNFPADGGRKEGGSRSRASSLTSMFRRVSLSRGRPSRATTPAAPPEPEPEPEAERYVESESSEAAPLTSFMNFDSSEDESQGALDVFVDKVFRLRSLKTERRAHGSFHRSVSRGVQTLNRKRHDIIEGVTSRGGSRTRTRQRRETAIQPTGIEYVRDFTRLHRDEQAAREAYLRTSQGSSGNDSIPPYEKDRYHNATYDVPSHGVYVRPISPSEITPPRGLPGDEHSWRRKRYTEQSCGKASVGTPSPHNSIDHTRGQHYGRNKSSPYSSIYQPRGNSSGNQSLNTPSPHSSTYQNSTITERQMDPDEARIAARAAMYGTGDSTPMQGMVPSRRGSEASRLSRYPPSIATALSAQRESYRTSQSTYRTYDSVESTGTLMTPPTPGYSFPDPYLNRRKPDRSYRGSAESGVFGLQDDNRF